MMKIDLTHSQIKLDEFHLEDNVRKIDEMIRLKTGAGNDYLGWADYPLHIDMHEVKRIKEDAKYVREHFDTLVVCGIGGSYLGARAVYEALKGLYPEDNFEIIFLGQTFSPTYTYQILKKLENRRFAINVISKSGTTTETSIAFRLVKKLLIEKIGLENAKKAIYITTDKEKGLLRPLEKEGYPVYTLPSDIGGRYSVFTPVGLFPLACANIDIDAFIQGMKDGMEKYSNPNLKENACYQYALTRFAMKEKLGKDVELFVTYEPQFQMVGEWLKQLFGESEGKEHKGIFPASCCFSTDLHSLGQFIQEGTPLLFETIIYVDNPLHDVTVEEDKLDEDQLNYLAHKNLSFVNEKAFLGTLSAHAEVGNVPCNVIKLEKMDERSLGELLYFFMRACAMSCYLLDINPFNQPGVEVYKKNMFKLLGKK